MRDDPIPAGMELDLAALEAADAAFDELERPPSDDPWEVLAWEASTRIDLVVNARAELARSR